MGTTERTSGRQNRRTLVDLGWQLDRIEQKLDRVLASVSFGDVSSANHQNTKPMSDQTMSELGVVLPDLPTDEQVKSLPELRKRRGSAA